MSRSYSLNPICPKFISYKRVFEKSKFESSTVYAVQITVNSEIFARVLFLRNFAYGKFCENKILAKSRNHSFHYCESYQSREIFRSKVCLLTLFAKELLAIRRIFSVVDEIHLNCDVCHWKDETGVFQFIFRCFAPLDPRCPLDNDISLQTFTTYVKGILGLGGQSI